MRRIAMLLTVAGISALSALARAADTSKTKLTSDGKVSPDTKLSGGTKLGTDTTVRPDAKILPACETVCGGAWSTSGNPNGNSAFLGTTDATPLVLRTNGQDRIRVAKDYDSVKVGLLNLSGVFGTLSNRQAVIHFLKAQESEATSNVYLSNPSSGVLVLNGHAAPGAGRGRLEVNGVIRTFGNGGGVMFPDGTIQQTAQVKGDPGPIGPPGPPGPTGVVSFYFREADLSIPSGSYATETADCEPGDFVVGGGYGCDEKAAWMIWVYQAKPVKPNFGNGPQGYKLFALNKDPNNGYTCHITAVCADNTP